MPIERRDVLFSLNETAPLLARVADKYPLLIPGDVSQLKIIEVMHTRDTSKSFHDQRTRMLALLTEAPRDAGVIFRATRSAGLPGARTCGFFVPEDVILDVLLDACRSLSIVLPKRASKVALKIACILAAPMCIQVCATQLYG